MRFEYDQITIAGRPFPPAPSPPLAAPLVSTPAMRAAVEVDEAGYRAWSRYRDGLAVAQRIERGGELQPEDLEVLPATLARVALAHTVARAVAAGLFGWLAEPT